VFVCVYCVCVCVRACVCSFVCFLFHPFLAEKTARGRKGKIENK
jgi:hypothetical protein